MDGFAATFAFVHILLCPEASFAMFSGGVDFVVPGKHYHFTVSGAAVVDFFGRHSHFLEQPSEDLLPGTSGIVGTPAASIPSVSDINLSVPADPVITVEPIVPVKPIVTVECVDNSNDERIARLVEEVRGGLLHAAPERISNGVNGTYFLKDKLGRKVAIFKPANEEFACLDGDDGDSDSASEWGLLPGESMVREAAAYRVAREHSSPDYIDVPPTALVRIRAPATIFAATSLNSSMRGHLTPDDVAADWTETVGSLQAFVEADGDCDELGPDAFEASDVHKIGILDVQILNCDRNSENMLVKRGDDSARLVPIDHGLSMPGSLSLGYGRFEWLNWPQSRRPFDADSRRYIEEIDVDRVMEMLRRDYSVRPECLDAVRVSSTFLKRAAAAGLTLFTIGSAICRSDPDAPSDLEQAYAAAKDAAGPAHSTDDADPVFQAAMDAELQTLVNRLGSEAVARKRLF